MFVPTASLSPHPTSLLRVTVGLWQSGLNTCTSLVPAVSVWGAQTEDRAIYNSRSISTKAL